ncbi:unnamed protein product [Trichobilharzia regenti]|nr:unnamed protein product [Trichobilharzia regenti]
MFMKPPRVRKKSRYYDDDYYEPPTSYKPRVLHSPRPQVQAEEMPQKVRKPHKSMIGHMPWRSQMHHPERRLAQANAVRLRENDFRICLRESFPNVKTRRLSRAHWSLLRRLMGKPRRCSTAFFDEERRSLNEKREKIRTLQTTRSLSVSYSVARKGVPMLELLINDVVCLGTWVRYPTDGLYTGKVDAIDALRHCYRVTFDKPALGTRSIPDYEVLSILPQETIPLSAYKTQHKASQAAAAAAGGSGGAAAGSNTAMRAGFMSGASSLLSTPLKLPAISSGDVAATMGSAALSLNNSEPSGGRLLLNEADIYGGYPMKFLVMVVRYIYICISCFCDIIIIIITENICSSGS